jgi:hypothetical protein
MVAEWRRIHAEARTKYVSFSGLIPSKPTGRPDIPSRDPVSRCAYGGRHSEYCGFNHIGGCRWATANIRRAITGQSGRGGANAESVHPRIEKVPHQPCESITTYRYVQDPDGILNHETLETHERGRVQLIHAGLFRRAELA